MINNPFFEFPVRSTARLDLRAPIMADSISLYSYRSHPHFCPVIRVPAFTQEWEAQAHLFERLKGFYNQKLISWAVCQKGDGAYIGSVTLRAFSGDSFLGGHRLEISSEINHNFRNQGFITEAKREIIGWAFKELPALQRIHSEISSANEASIRVNKKLGFLQEGCLRSFEYQGLVPVDIVVMSLLRGDNTVK